MDNGLVDHDEHEHVKSLRGWRCVQQTPSQLRTSLDPASTPPATSSGPSITSITPPNFTPQAPAQNNSPAPKQTNSSASENSQLCSGRCGGQHYRESHGNPGSANAVSGGLFGEEISNGGSASSGSLQEQLGALYQYIDANGSISGINANAGSPTQAANYFCYHYERPGIPDIQMREPAALWVASNNWG